MRKPLLLIVLHALLFASCGGGRQVATRFYVLEFPDGGSVAAEQGLSPLPGSGLIERPAMHQAFSTHQIALREDSYEIRYFSFNEWASRPDQSLSAMMLTFFREFPAFDQGVSMTETEGTRFRIETHVPRLEVIQVRNDFHARLDVEFRLVELPGGEVLHTHDARRQQPLRQRNLNLFAQAVSEMFVEELHVFANGMLRQAASAE